MLFDSDYKVFDEQRLNPTVICVVGPNGSGKSSTAIALGITDPGMGFSQNRMKIDRDSGKVFVPFVNADRMSKQIRACCPELTQQDADAIAFKLAEEKRLELASARCDFGYETVGSHESKVDFLRKLGASGYVVVVLFFGTESPDINKRRVANRVASGGHDVDPDKIEARWRRTMGLLPRYFEVADFMAVYDNSRDNCEGENNGPRLLLVKTLQGEVELSPAFDEVEWIRKYLPDIS